MIIPQIMIAAVNACQRNCEHCSHRGMRENDVSYHMPLEDLVLLVRRVKLFGCRIETIMFNGPGEPLLWRYFNDAVQLLKKENISQRICVATNGLLLSTIQEDVWRLLSCVYISRYGDVLNETLIEKHKDRISFYPGGQFQQLITESIPAKEYGGCSCPGPLYYKRAVFPHCGPVLFDAAKKAGEDPFKFSVPLSQWDPTKHPIMPHLTFLPCSWCFGNKALPRITVPNLQVKNAKA